MFIREIVERAPAQPDEGPLALANPHERDACIMFREEDHAYFVFHKASDTYLRLWKSVSGLYKLYFSDFDAEAMSRTVARKRKADKQSPYYWLIQHQACPDDEEAVAATIRDAWSRLGDRASSEGTEGHRLLESKMNYSDFEVSLKTGTPRERHISKMARAGAAWIDERVAAGWRPHRAEWSIFIDGSTVGEAADGNPIRNQEHIIAGQLDALFFEPSTEQYHLVDWKFCGEHKLSPTSGEFRGVVPMGKGPLKDVPDNSFGHYLAQQSIYAFILRKRYSITVASARLVHIPSDVAEPKAVEVPLTLLPDDVVERLFAK